MFLKGLTTSQNHVLCANFVKIGWPEIGKVVRCLPDKKQNCHRSPALASARIAPKICQGQLQTMYSEFPKFHPNPFTSGGVIAECVNIVETRHKVFPILGEASPSKNKLPPFLWFTVWKTRKLWRNMWINIMWSSDFSRWSLRVRTS